MSAQQTSEVRTDTAKETTKTQDVTVTTGEVKKEPVNIIRKLEPVFVDQCNRDVRKIFDKYDVDKSGQVDVTDLDKLLKDYKAEHAEDESSDEEPYDIAEFRKILDRDNDGKLHFDEFIGLILKMRDPFEKEWQVEMNGSEITNAFQKLTPEEVECLNKVTREAFDRYDADKSGQLELADFDKAIRDYKDKYGENNKGLKYLKEDIESKKKLDTDADGKVSYDEFFSHALRESGFEIVA